MDLAAAVNTTVKILRGTTVDDLGNEVDLNEPVFQGLPAALMETNQTTQDPTTPTPRTIRSIYLAVPAYVGLQTTDRVLDEWTGDTYMVIEVIKPPTIVGAPVDTRALLKRVTGSTT